MEFEPGDKKSMKTTLIVLVLLLGALIGYADYRNPAGCEKVLHDTGTLVQSLIPGAPPVTTAAPVPNSAVPSPHPTPSALPAGAPATLAAAPAPASAPDSAAPPAPATPDANQPWAPPAVTPSQPNWTWTTDDGKTYQNVVITKIDPDSVTITHSMGVAHLDTATLPPDIQKQLNYDPAARAAAQATTRAQEWTTDYQAALSSARAQNKLVLLDFTGSDWCGYCKLLDQEVFTQASFKDFAGRNYVLVTLDYPHQTQLPPDLKQQNDGLNKQFRITGYPTLIVVTPDGKELGREVGYNPGSGPNAVIAELKTHKQN